MAGLYRERLLAEGRLEKSPLIDSFGLSVDLFMGVEENGMFNNALVSVTTAEQAGEILDFCEERGYADSLFTLVGWQKGGWGRFPNAAAVDSAFGRQARAFCAVRPHRGLQWPAGAADRSLLCR